MTGCRFEWNSKHSKPICDGRLRGSGVGRTMWTRLAATYVLMDRLRKKTITRPIFDAKLATLLNWQHSRTENHTMYKQNTTSTNRVVLVKGNHQWRFEWGDGQELSTVKAITEIAKSAETDFDWFDAAMVCHEMSKITSKAA